MTASERVAHSRFNSVDVWKVEGQSPPPPPPPPRGTPSLPPAPERDNRWFSALLGRDVRRDTRLAARTPRTRGPLGWGWPHGRSLKPPALRWVALPAAHRAGMFPFCCVFCGEAVWQTPADLRILCGAFRDQEHWLALTLEQFSGQRALIKRSRYLASPQERLHSATSLSSSKHWPQTWSAFRIPVILQKPANNENPRL